MGTKLLLIAVSLVPLLPGARTPSPREILRLTRSRDAGDRLRAAKLLSNIAGRAGTLLLLDLAGDDDPEVRQRARSALRPRRSPADLDLLSRRGLRHPLPRTRIAALGLLAEARAPGLRGQLERVLADRDPGVREAAVNQTVNVLGGEGLPLLAAALSRGKAGRPRAAALLAMEELDSERAVTLANTLVGDKAYEVRVAALEITRDFDRLTAALRDESWSVRLTAMRRLSDSKEPLAIPPLIDTLERERGRLRREAAATLTRLTGLGLPPDAERWRTWWEREGARFELPERPGKAAPEPSGSVATFHTIPVVSDSVAFVIDRSRSMRQRVTRGDEKTKARMVEEELLATLTRLKPPARFLLVAFRTKPNLFLPRTVPATGAARRRAIDWLRKLKPAGRTNLFDALAAALEASDVDTVFLLTDGAPSAGEHRERGPILRAVDSLNRYRKAVIHTVEIGGGTTGKKWEGFLDELSRRTGGIHVGR